MPVLIMHGKFHPKRHARRREYFEELLRSVISSPSTGHISSQQQATGRNTTGLTNSGRRRHINLVT